MDPGKMIEKPKGEMEVRIFNDALKALLKDNYHQLDLNLQESCDLTARYYTPENYPVHFGQLLVEKSTGYQVLCHIRVKCAQHGHWRQLKGGKFKCESASDCEARSRSSRSKDETSIIMEISATGDQAEPWCQVIAEVEKPVVWDVDGPMQANPRNRIRMSKAKRSFPGFLVGELHVLCERIQAKFQGEGVAEYDTHLLTSDKLKTRLQGTHPTPLPAGWHIIPLVYHWSNSVASGTHIVGVLFEKPSDGFPVQSVFWYDSAPGAGGADAAIQLQQALRVDQGGTFHPNVIVRHDQPNYIDYSKVEITNGCSFALLGFLSNLKLGLLVAQDGQLPQVEPLCSKSMVGASLGELENYLDQLMALHCETTDSSEKQRVLGNFAKSKLTKDRFHHSMKLEASQPFRESGEGGYAAAVGGSHGETDSDDDDDDEEDRPPTKTDEKRYPQCGWCRERPHPELQEVHLRFHAKEIKDCLQQFNFAGTAWCKHCHKPAPRRFLEFHEPCCRLSETYCTPELEAFRNGWREIDRPLTKEERTKALNSYQARSEAQAHDGSDSQEVRRDTTMVTKEPDELVHLGPANNVHASTPGEGEISPFQHRSHSQPIRRNPDSRSVTESAYDTNSSPPSRVAAIYGAQIAPMVVPPVINLQFCLIQLILAEGDQIDASACSEIEGGFGPWVLHCEASLPNAQLRIWFDASPSSATCSTDSMMGFSSPSDILGAIRGLENLRYVASRVLEVPAEWANEQFPLPDKEEAQQQLNALAVAANAPQLVWLQNVQGPTIVNAHRAIRPRTQQDLDLYGPVMTHFELNALLLSAAREVSQLDLEVTRRTFYMTQESLFHILDTLTNPSDVLFSDDVKQYLTFPPEEMNGDDIVFVLLSYTTRATQEEARECLETNGVPLGHSISAMFQPLNEEGADDVSQPKQRHVLLFDAMGATLPSQAAQADLQERVGASTVVTLNQANTFSQFFTCTTAWEHNCVTVAEELSGKPLVTQPVTAAAYGGALASVQTNAHRFHKYYRKNNCGSLLLSQYFHLALGREEFWQESSFGRAVHARSARFQQTEPVTLPPFSDRDPTLAGERLAAIAPMLQSPSTTSSLCWCVARTMTTHVQLYGELFLTPDFLVFHGQGNPSNNGDTDDTPILEVFSMSEIAQIRLNDHNSTDGAWMVDSTDQDQRQYEITVQIPQGSVAFHSFATLAEYNALRIHWMRAKPMHLYSPELLFGATPASFGYHVRQLLVLAYGDRDNAPEDFEDGSHQDNFVDSLMGFLHTQQPVQTEDAGVAYEEYADPRGMVGAGTVQPSLGAVRIPNGDECRICSMRVCKTLRRTHLAEHNHVRMIEQLNEMHMRSDRRREQSPKEEVEETKESPIATTASRRKTDTKPFCDTCGMPVPEMMFYSHMQVCHKDSYFHLNGFKFDPVTSGKEKLEPVVQEQLSRKVEEEKTRLARAKYEMRRRAGEAEQWQPQAAGPNVQSSSVRGEEPSSKSSGFDTLSTAGGLSSCVDTLVGSVHSTGGMSSQAELGTSSFTGTTMTRSAGVGDGQQHFLAGSQRKRSSSFERSSSDSETERDSEQPVEWK